jgi:hypothetical protein
MARITGIGGVLFKRAGGHAALAAWYRKHPGLSLEGVAGDDMERQDQGRLWREPAQEYLHP